MVAWFALLLAFTSTCVSVASALYAVNYWKRASESFSRLKNYHQVTQDMVDLQSSMSNLLESHKRLRSKIGMQELRARRSGEEATEEPTSTVPNSKATLRRSLGLYGNDQARAAQSIHNGSRALNGK